MNHIVHANNTNRVSRILPRAFCVEKFSVPTCEKRASQVSMQVIASGAGFAVGARSEGAYD